MVLSEYISETPEGIKKIIYHLGEELIEVEATIKEEKTIPKAHLVHERRRRNLKKHRHKCLTDFLSPESAKNKNAMKQSYFMIISSSFYF